MNTAAIIGSGFGGLAEAIRLQARGFNVTMFEKRPQVGGRACQLVKNGYTFDTGPSLVTAPFIIDRVFASAGRKLREYVDLVPLDPFYRIYFHDKSYMDYSGDPERMKVEMTRFSREDAAQYDRFFDDIKGIYDAVITEGLGSSPFMTWSRFLRFAPRALSLGRLRPVYNFAGRYFKDERNRFAFSFHPLFIGGSPFRTPSVYIMIPYLEREAGVWFARGGMYSLVKAFARLFEELGGVISHLGNAFSTEPRLTQSALFRPHNRSEDVRRLYFVGAGTHPGGGVPGVLLSAEATEKCILEDFGESASP